MVVLSNVHCSDAGWLDEGLTSTEAGCWPGAQTTKTFKIPSSQKLKAFGYTHIKTSHQQVQELTPCVGQIKVINSRPSPPLSHYLSSVREQ